MPVGPRRPRCATDRARRQNLLISKGLTETLALHADRAGPQRSGPGLGGRAVPRASGSLGNTALQENGYCVNCFFCGMLPLVPQQLVNRQKGQWALDFQGRAEVYRHRTTGFLKPPLRVASR